MAPAILNEGGEICPVCEGEGKNKCYDCKGVGVRILSAHESTYGVSERARCSACEGNGTIQCPRCHGTGKILGALPAGQDRVLVCSVPGCGVSNKNDPSVFNANVEGRGVHLCSKHAVDYHARWRVDCSQGRPDVGGYLESMES